MKLSLCSDGVLVQWFLKDEQRACLCAPYGSDLVAGLTPGKTRIKAFCALSEPGPNLSEELRVTALGVEARDGIEPPNKVLQTLPFSFWVPRRVDTTSTYRRLRFSRTEECNLSCDSPPSRSLSPSPERSNVRNVRESQLENEHTFNLEVCHIPGVTYIEL
jgi:hypothetical protein